MFVQNKFLELSNMPVLNTDNAIRYSLLHQAKPESLANHISEVSILSYIISLHLKSLGDDINIGLLLEKVILHDLDEVLTGDIPRSTKYYSEEGLIAMKVVAKDAIVRLAEKIPGGERIVTQWDSAKEGKEGMILVLVDMLAVARKVVNEVKMLGNGHFLKVAYEMVTNLDDLSRYNWGDYFTAEGSMYINTVIMDAKSVMSDLVHEDDRLHQFGVLNNIFTKSKE